MKKWRNVLAAAMSVSLLLPGAAFAEVPLSEKETTYKAAQQDKQLTDVQTLVIKYSKALPQSIHKKAGVSVLKRLPGLQYDVVQVPKTKKVSEAVRIYQEREEVIAITPSVQYKAFAGAADPKAAKMDHLAALNMGKALSIAGKNKVTIAVVDSGVDFKHPDLKENLLKPYNAVNPVRNPVRSLHGTHVAGIIASVKNNGLGGYGVFPNAQILPVDVFNGSIRANDFTIAEGIVYSVDQGADVINLSLGGFMPSGVIEEAVQYAVDSGVAVVAAAGNESTDQYAYPAAYPGVISVGNVSGGKILSDSSNYGASVDVVAPGENIYSTAYDSESGSKFDRLTGTSMASPMVAAAAGLLKSKYPDLTPFDIEYILEQTATDLGEKGYDLTYGNGLINPLNALKFDVKKLPKRPDASGETLLKTAKEIQTGKNTFAGAFSSPGGMHWFKANMQEGQHVQMVLNGNKSYDYALELYFMPEEGEPEYIQDVNRTGAGGQEAYLYTAAEAGTLVAGVKDANGNYSLSGKSAFELTAEKHMPIKPDTATYEQPVVISSVPFVKRDFTLYSGEAEMPDSDYFAFSVTEPKLVSFSVSDLPGVDSAINVYEKEHGEEYPIISENNQPLHQGETVSLQAVPDIEYRVEVTNGAYSTDKFMDSLLDLLSMDGSVFEELAIGESVYPYTLKVEERQVPPDEDGLPDGEMVETDLISEKEKYEAGNGQEETEESAEDMILQRAVPYTLGKSKQGYFQTEYDEDYYRFTAPADGIYSFTVTKGSSQMPTMTLLEAADETGELLPVAGSGSEEDLVMSLLGSSFESNKLNAALQKGKTYVMLMANSLAAVSADPYTLSSEKISDVPAEKDHDFNMPEEGLEIKTGKSYQNYFIQAADTDYYYFKNEGKARVYTLDITEKAFTSSQKASIPAELRPGHIFSGAIMEDTNGDKVLDEEEMVRAMPFGPDLFSMSIETEVHTSFAAKAGTSYFIEAAPFLPVGPNLQPYELKVGATYNEFADGDGKVVNHIPAKPLPLKTVNGQYGARGYFNAGVPFGDVDHFALHMAKEGTVSFTFKGGSRLDGVLEIYNAKGRLIGSFDRYGINDEELASVKLAKGTYFIELSEANGTASTEPYELIIKK